MKFNGGIDDIDNTYMNVISLKFMTGHLGNFVGHYELYKGVVSTGSTKNHNEHVCICIMNLHYIYA